MKRDQQRSGERCALKPFFALRMLAESGCSVRLSLERGDLPVARQALQSLVSRERSQLTEELAGAAAIESLAENLGDSIVAPLFYYTLLGLRGAAAYRLFNTFDSMIGYHGQYEYLGKAAARLDDLLNVLPARLTAMLIIALAPLFGGNRRKAWQIWRRDAGRTLSPNAGHPMAAAAGALGVQLEKAGHYRLGDNDKTITAASIWQAERMVWSIWLDQHHIDHLAEASQSNGAMLVVDEAYWRFVFPKEAYSAIELMDASRRQQLIVLRSLTKDCALAGLRLGYAVSSLAVTERLGAQLPSWNVNGVAQAAGVAALTDRTHLKTTLDLLAIERQTFFHALRHTGLNVIPSRTHFCLIEVGDAHHVRQQLLDRNILVRDCTSFGLPQFVRVATRQVRDWQQLLLALQEIKGVRVKK